MKKAILIGVLILGIGGFVFYPKFSDYRFRQKIESENESALNDVKTSTIQTETKIDSKLKPLEKAYLEVPFYCQAPHQNAASWKIHHASCEEAAVLQAVHFHKNMKMSNMDSVDRVLQDMVAWQEKNWGIHKDIHADSVKMLMVKYFGYAEDQIKILRKATVADIKNWVSRGYPVIAPTYGRTLNNPFYTAPGPMYHMVTVIGYTTDRIITNDVGTKRGKDFSYPNDIFQKSMDEEGADCLVIVVK